MLDVDMCVSWWKEPKIRNKNKDQQSRSLRKPQLSPKPNLKRAKQERLWIKTNPDSKKVIHSLNSVDIKMWYGVGSPGLGWHPCYESWCLKYSVGVPPSWEKPRSIASSPHVVLVTLVSMACCQFATHRVLCVQVSTTPVVCQPVKQWLSPSVHQSSARV